MKHKKIEYSRRCILKNSRDTHAWQDEGGNESGMEVGRIGCGGTLQEFTRIRSDSEMPFWIDSWGETQSHESHYIRRLAQENALIPRLTGYMRMNSSRNQATGRVLHMHWPGVGTVRIDRDQRVVQRNSQDFCASLRDRSASIGKGHITGNPSYQRTCLGSGGFGLDPRQGEETCKCISSEQRLSRGSLEPKAAAERCKNLFCLTNTSGMVLSNHKHG